MLAHLLNLRVVSKLCLSPTLDPLLPLTPMFLFLPKNKIPHNCLLHSPYQTRPSIYAVLLNKISIPFCICDSVSFHAKWNSISTRYNFPHKSSTHININLKSHSLSFRGHINCHRRGKKRKPFRNSMLFLWAHHKQCCLQSFEFKKGMCLQKADKQAMICV